MFYWRWPIHHLMAASLPWSVLLQQPAGTFQHLTSRQRAWHSVARSLLSKMPMRQLTMEEKVVNYCLSHTRHVVENAFGLLAAWSCIFRGPILLREDNAYHVVQAAVVLHSFCCKSSKPGRLKLIAPLLLASGGMENWRGWEIWSITMEHMEVTLPNYNAIDWQQSS